MVNFEKPCEFQTHFFYELFDLQKPKTLSPVLDMNDTLNWPENIVWLRSDAVRPSR